MACEVNENTIKNGIYHSVTSTLDDSGLFTDVVDLKFSPKDPKNNFQEIINDINTKYDSRIIRKLDEGDNVYQMYVFDKLAAQYLRAFDSRDHDFEDYRAAINEIDESAIRVEAGMDDNTTADDFIKDQMQEYAPQIAEFRKANPNFTVEFTDEDSQYDPGSNRVFLSLRELYLVSQKNNIPFRQVVSLYAMHEMAHAASYHAIETGKNDQFLQTIFSAVQEHHKNNPFTDNLRQGYTYNGEPYAFKNIHEFVADAFGNPYFQEYLRSVPIEDNRNMWQKFIDSILGFFGLKTQPNYYDKVIEYINSDRIQRDNQAGSEFNYNSWSPVLVFRGNPKNYLQATYDLFTSTTIQDDVEAVIKKLPSAVLKIKQSLDRETNPDKIKSLQKLLDSYNEVREQEDLLKVSINMLAQAAVIASEIETQLVKLDTMTDDAKKIALAHSLLTSSESLDFIAGLANEIRILIKKEGATPGLKTFAQQMGVIITVHETARETFVKITQPAVIKVLTDAAGKSEAEDELTKQIDNLNKVLENPNLTTRQITVYNASLKNYKAQLEMIPNRNTFEKMFAGQLEDASSGQMMFEAAIMNGHAMASTAMKIITKNNIELSQEMLGIENKHQTYLDRLKKVLNKSSIRKTNDFYQPITDIAERADEAIEDENGNITYKYTKQRMLLSSYSPEYIKQATEKTALINYYFTKLNESGRLKNDEAAQKYGEKLSAAYAARKNFYRENSEAKYADEVLQMWDLLDKELMKDDGTTTTFLRERGYIFERIEDLEKHRDTSLLPEEQTRVQEEIEQLYIEQKQLRSKWNEDGSEKTGFALQLANLAQEYSELKTKYGTYELTTQGLGMFNKEVTDLKDRLRLGTISKADYDRRIAEMTVTEVSDEYYAARKFYSDRVSALVEQLAAIPEFSKIFKDTDKDRLKDGYDKIREIVKPFRDSELVIDGQLFSKVRPLLIKEIQAIQQEHSNLTAASQRLKGISIEEHNTLRDLRLQKRRGEITDEGFEQLNALEEKLATGKELYNKYKDLIDSYNENVKQLQDLNESTNSEYYQREIDSQLSQGIAEKFPDILKQVLTNDSMLGGRFFRTAAGEWMELDRIEGDGTRIAKNIDISGFKDKDEAVAFAVARSVASDELMQSKWWSDHHFDKYVWDNKTKTYNIIDAPIYIWVKTEPKDKSFINPQQPSIRYKTYNVNPEYENKSFQVLNDGIPMPKAGKFANDRYNDLKGKTDEESKAYFSYLESMRTEYRNAQTYYPDNRKMADILPSFVKTHDEAKVEATEALKHRAGKMLGNNIALGTAGTGTGPENADEQVQTGGSTTDYFAKNRIIPTRFANRMDINKQSADIPAMVLGFTLAAREFNKMTEDQPLLEALRIHAEGLDVMQSKAIGARLGLSNLWSAIKSDSKRTSVKKDTDKTTISKTMDHILDTFLYKETKKSANITVRGRDVDVNKISSNLKKFSSTSIFAFNIFSAVKNTLSATIQANLNANIGKGYFTKSQYNKAKLEAISMTKNYLSDYTKFGNKSLIGQELDYFQVMQGATYNKFGEKTAWTALKSAGDFMTSFKNASEFELQVSQYLAMSKANPVKVNGQWVEFRKAFALNAEGTLAPVQGAEITPEQTERFMRKLAYVNRMINGAYRAEERNSLQKNILGDLAFYLNGYMIPGVVNRFAKTRYSAEADMIMMGYHTQMIKLLGDFIKYRGDIKTKWATMTVEEKNRVMRSLNEILTVMGFMLLSLAMGGGDNKKKLQQNSAIYNSALALMIGVKSETETFIPLPGMGLNEIARKINSPFAALRQITNIIKVLENLSMLVIGSDTAFYKQKGHGHKKGDAKVVSNFLRLLGYSGTAFDPVEKALQMEKAQQLR